MKAQVPLSFCISATTCRVSVVLPDDLAHRSRPRGRAADRRRRAIEAERNRGNDLDVLDDSPNPGADRALAGAFDLRGAAKRLCLLAVDGGVMSCGWRPSVLLSWRMLKGWMLYSGIGAFF
jgi:hypothetical protein